jgi:hypothetical protein
VHAVRCVARRHGTIDTFQQKTRQDRCLLVYLSLEFDSICSVLRRVMTSVRWPEDGQCVSTRRASQTCASQDQTNQNKKKGNTPNINTKNCISSSCCNNFHLYTIHTSVSNYYSKTCLKRTLYEREFCLKRKYSQAP